jgi:hypothetical protein
MNPLTQQTQTTKRVIKLTYSQAQEMLKAIKSFPAPAHLPPTIVRFNTAPLTPKKTCGLFNEEENVQQDIGTDMDAKFNLNQSDLINDSNEITLPLGETQSKFAKKLQSLNMKIKIPPVAAAGAGGHQTGQNEMSIFDYKLTEDEWNTLINSSNEFLVPNCDEDDSSMKNIYCDTAAIEKALLETDMFSQSFLEDNQVDMMMPEVSAKTEKAHDDNNGNNVFLTDHIYSMSNEESTAHKRNSSFLDDTNSQDACNSFSDSTSVNGSVTKKQRTRGIYRLDDVTNDEEYQNYLERRKKNNISSKASRANKKSLYNEMDAKSDFLEQENERLKMRIVKMEDLSKIIKDMLVEKFGGK